MTVATLGESRAPSHARDDRPIRHRRRALAVFGAVLTVAVTLVPGGAGASPLPGGDPCGAVQRPVTMVPELTSILVGSQAADLAAQAPLLLADARGYFTDAGFTTPVSVRVVQEPLPGLLNGQLALAILDARGVADAIAAGVPLRIVAGYQDPTLADVTPRVVVASSDTVARYPGTVAAATAAYIRALEDLRDPALAAGFLDDVISAGFVVSDTDRAAWPAQAAAFQPFDGAFGDPAVDGGLAGLRAALVTSAGVPIEPAPLISWDTLWAAQASMGTPLDPAPGSGPGVPLTGPSPSPRPLSSPSSGPSSGPVPSAVPAPTPSACPSPLPVPSPVAP